MALTVFNSILRLLPPLILAWLVDKVFGQGQWGLLGLMIGLWVLHSGVWGLSSMFNRYLMAWVSYRISFDMRLAMYRRLQRLGLTFFHRNSTGMVLQRLMDDVTQVRNLCTEQMIQVLMDSAVCLFALTIMFMMNWHLTLVALLFMPLYLLNYRTCVKRIRAANRDLRGKYDDISDSLAQNLDGALVVKSFGQEERETREYTQECSQALVLGLRTSIWGGLFNSTSVFVKFAAQSLILFLGCWLVIDEAMTYGQVLAFVAYVQYVLDPVATFSDLFNQIEQSMVSVVRVTEVMEAEPDILDKPDAIGVERLKGKVEFEGLSFKYDSRKIQTEESAQQLQEKTDGADYAVEDVSFRIEQGQTVALVGHTGAGKTTIAKLMCRFYDATAGRLLLDGVDIRDWRLADVRRNIAVVPQEPVLFKASIAENIAYGRPRASMEEIIEAAKVAELHAIVANLPEGYDTQIGEANLKLSSGQRQRVAIARAVLKDPTILILDEATSSLDTESERMIQRALKRIMDQRTSLVIAHRLSTIVYADLIVVMKEGRVIEQGTHEQLLKRRGHYRQLYERQFSADT